MIISKTDFQDLYVIENTPFTDDRGFFSRIYCKKEFAQICTKEIVQINQSVNLEKGTIRGMHYQASPFMENKMIKCIQGSVFDVVVDIRKKSPTFLKWFGVTLSRENNKLIYIPEGFAHGFQTLEDKTELLYLHTEYYSPQHERGIHFNDPVIKINWPVGLTNYSVKDFNFPFISNEFIGI